MSPKPRSEIMVARLKRVPACIWIMGLLLPALTPLFRSGYVQLHDGHIHLYRLAALDRAVRSGVLYPRWFPEFGFGYGQPVLNFYGPLSYYWGLPFTLLGFDPVVALKIVAGSGLVASALGMYLLARLYVGRIPAIVAALVYAYMPYHLVDLYVRGALAEFLSFVWFPLVLWALHRLIVHDKPHAVTRLSLLALLLVALVTTHSLSALIFAPVVAAYGGILLVRCKDGRAVGLVGLAFGLAVAASAFYWLPVLAESQYVGLGHGTSTGYVEHLVALSDLFSWSPAYPYPGESGETPTYPLGLVQILLLAAALMWATISNQRRWTVVLFLVVALCSVFLLTQASAPVWRALHPILAFLQYPWRFQGLALLATAFLSGVLVDQIPRRRFAQSLVASGLLLFLGVWSLWRLPVLPSQPDLTVEAMWQIDKTFGQVGATWTGEYLPVWVQEQRWALAYSERDLPAEHDVPAVNLPPLDQSSARLVGVGYNRYDLVLDAPQDTMWLLHQFHYPGWQAHLEPAGDVHPSQPQGVLGLASFDLPAAQGQVRLALGLTPAQRIGIVISLCLALVLGTALVARYQLAGSRSAISPLLLAGGYLVLAAILIASLALPHGYVRQPHQVGANLEDTVDLLAYRTGREAYHPGEEVAVTLYWLARRKMDRDYRAFVHLTDLALTSQPAQHDGNPGGGFTPTTRWLPGELVPDVHYLALPRDLAPGRYRLWAGMYEPEQIRNLTVLTSSTQAADNRVLLGEIEVVGP